jgi:hypothetical protein
MKRGAFAQQNEAAESEIDEEDTEELTFEVHTENFAPGTAIFEEGFAEDEDENVTLSSDLVESISEVEKVYHDMDSRAREAVEPNDDQEDEHVVEEVVVLHTPIDNASVFTQEPKSEDEVEEELASFASSSPFETEIDPVTGVYRLKVKAPADESQQQSQENQEHPHAQHDGSHSAEGTNANQESGETYSQLHLHLPPGQQQEGGEHHQPVENSWQAAEENAREQKDQPVERAHEQSSENSEDRQFNQPWSNESEQKEDREGGPQEQQNNENEHENRQHEDVHEHHHAEHGA